MVPEVALKCSSLITIFLGALLAAAGCDSRGKPADFTLKDLDGKDVSLSTFRGKAVLLAFWAAG